MVLISIRLDLKVIHYATESVSGKKYNSQITVGNGNLVVENQVIGVADSYV